MFGTRLNYNCHLLEICFLTSKLLKSEELPPQVAIWVSSIQNVPAGEKVLLAAGKARCAIMNRLKAAPEPGSKVGTNTQVPAGGTCLWEDGKADGGGVALLLDGGDG